MSEGYREMLFGLSGLKQDQQTGTSVVLSFNLIRDVSGAVIASMDNGAQAMQLELRDQDVERLRAVLDRAQPAAIPLSERKPGPEDWVTAGPCSLVWLGHQTLSGYWSWEFTDVCFSSDHTHWLPATAQFLPARVEG